MTICKNCHIFIWQFEYDNFFKEILKYDNMQYDNILRNQWYMTIYHDPILKNIFCLLPFTSIFLEIVKNSYSNS